MCIYVYSLALLIYVYIVSPIYVYVCMYKTYIFKYVAGGGRPDGPHGRGAVVQGAAPRNLSLSLSLSTRRDTTRRDATRHDTTRHDWSCISPPLPPMPVSFMSRLLKGDLSKAPRNLCLFTYPSICLSVCLSVCLSIYLYLSMYIDR
jgi:hypothetical protein